MQLAVSVVPDDVSLGHEFVFKALDRSHQVSHDCPKPSAGVTVLFAGGQRLFCRLCDMSRDFENAFILVPCPRLKTLKTYSLRTHVHVLKL
ncbi:hypothetical protein RRG08_053516 [Elysia crispata]|uniref:Uncharacterized protein n=1 Tax=Elysia crispata TaxID=231223 RepID=A0AAE1CRA1_9GAST|nr:hypothetical protein RRG08_053516 [Elysia crispata]